LLLAGLTPAQEREVERGEVRIEHGGLLRGHLDDANPRDVYFVEGLRGELIRFELTASAGGLDPVLAVFDAQGHLQLYRDDGEGETAALADLTLPRTGRYFVVAGRFGYGLGSSAGAYELRMTRKGVLSAGGSSLRYGDSVIGTISKAQPEVSYSFPAQQGDILDISMVRSSGTLDPVLRVYDSERALIAENDDQDSETRNARVAGLVVGRSGDYIILASRYDDSAGSFVLSIEQADGSGSGSRRDAPLALAYGQARAASIDAAQFERFYSFDAEAGDLVTIDMQRAGSGTLDSYLLLTDSDYRSLAEDDDSGAGQNARIIEYRIPADGQYKIIATRFEGAAGGTRGDFRISLERLDDPFTGVPPGTINLAFGSSVSGEITAEKPVDTYAFYGQRGELVSVSMTRVDGNLDALLELRNSAQELLAKNDDRAVNDKNALIADLPLPASGTYYITARRYGGNTGDAETTGSYVLVLAQPGA